MFSLHIPPHPFQWCSRSVGCWLSEMVTARCMRSISIKTAKETLNRATEAALTLTNTGRRGATEPKSLSDAPIYTKSYTL
uniref:Uncharacterized protein n=1 Tax=Anguilla anguilla TaxID=7936 RepID=A0A0E9X850_ANGAN